MSEQLVLIERKDEIAYLTLNRPKKGNALSADLVLALSDGIDRLVSAGARMLVFQGEGKHFCAGFDLSDLDAQSDAELLLRFVNLELLLQKVFSCPVTTVAVGKGRVMGAGADLFAACHRRIAVPSSSFAFPGAGFGIILGTRRLASLIGVDRARAILLSGETLSPELAFEAGLATDLVEDDGIAHVLSRIAQQAVRLDEPTTAAIHRLTRSQCDDADLADLVRSAARPGLVKRIAAYRERVRAAAKP